MVTRTASPSPALVGTDCSGPSDRRAGPSMTFPPWVLIGWIGGRGDGSRGPGLGRTSDRGATRGAMYSPTPARRPIRAATREPDAPAVPLAAPRWINVPEPGPSGIRTGDSRWAGALPPPRTLPHTFRLPSPRGQTNRTGILPYDAPLPGSRYPLSWGFRTPTYTPTSTPYPSGPTHPWFIQLLLALTLLSLSV